MPCHAMPRHAIISYNTFHGITCHYYTLHYIKLARTTITLQPYACLYYPYIYIYLFIYFFVYLFIYLFIYIYIYIHVYLHYCWFTTHVGEVSIPQILRHPFGPPRIAASSSTLVSLVRGSACWAYDESLLGLVAAQFWVMSKEVLKLLR